MKKIALLVALAAFVIGFVSCGGPEADAKKLVKMIKGQTELFEKVASDKKIDKDEAENIKKSLKELEDFNKEMEKKYENDKEGKDKVEKYFKDNETELEKVYDTYFKAMMSLYDCEGSENLDL